MGSRTVRIGAAILAAATVTAGWGAPAPAASENQTRAEGVWAPKQVDFLYRAFTTKFTCDGLRDRMRSVLLQLGARPDVQVITYGCMHTATPEPWPNVRIKMHVLEPVSGQSADAVPARWKTVDLAAGRDPREFAGECEFIEHVRQHVLPLFAARNVVANTSCVPRAPIIGSTELTAEILVVDAGPQSEGR